MRFVLGQPRLDTDLGCVSSAGFGGSVVNHIWSDGTRLVADLVLGEARPLRYFEMLRRSIAPAVPDNQPATFRTTSSGSLSPSRSATTILP